MMSHTQSRGTPTEPVCVRLLTESTFRCASELYMLCSLTLLRLLTCFSPLVLQELRNRSRHDVASFCGFLSNIVCDNEAEKMEPFYNSIYRSRPILVEVFSFFLLLKALCNVILGCCI